MITINSDFIASYKLGDNIHYNLNILTTLVAARKRAAPPENDAFIKPITLLIGAITEAILYDFLYRVRHFTREGVPRITEKKLKALRHSKKDEFTAMVELIKTHELFAKKKSDIYPALEEMINLRNRIHIQNKYDILESDEARVYTAKRMNNAAKTLERVMKGMQKHYLRPGGKKYVPDFVLPWNAKV